MNPKSNLRKLPDGRVVGSPKLQIVIFWEFAIEGFNRSHRGTEVISSPAARKALPVVESRCLPPVLCYQT
jgi:hypothetical protein